MSDQKFYTISAILILGLLLTAVPLRGQELEVNVDLNKSNISGSSISYVDELATKIETYVNDYEWLDHEFLEKERIKANFTIVLQNYNSENSNFEATLVVSSSRPIYNTTQSTQLMRIKDNNWSFTFKQGTSLTHDLLQFDSIASVIDYYVYILLGYDYDSFGPLSGSSHFNQAQSIVDLAQTSGGAGWSRGDSDQRNRYYLVNDLQSTGYEELRKAIYRYHRHGLDTFINDPEGSRKKILQALKMIQESKRNTTNEYLFDLFFSTKYEEIVAVFENAETDIRLEAYNLLTEIDPGHTSTYRELQ